jgi:hypothetical protein
MNILNTIAIFCREIFTVYWLFQEESVMHITGRVTLRLEKSIEVPERALNKFASWHFIESHFE